MIPTKKLILALTVSTIGIVGAVLANKAQKEERVTVYYQLPGEPVTSTVTIDCLKGPYRCQISVNGKVGDLYRDPQRRVPVPCGQEKCLRIRM